MNPRRNVIRKRRANKRIHGYRARYFPTVFQKGAYAKAAKRMDRFDRSLRSLKVTERGVE